MLSLFPVRYDGNAFLEMVGYIFLDVNMDWWPSVETWASILWKRKLVQSRRRFIYVWMVYEFRIGPNNRMVDYGRANRQLLSSFDPGQQIYHCFLLLFLSTRTYITLRINMYCIYVSYGWSQSTKPFAVKMKRSKEKKSRRKNGENRTKPKRETHNDRKW